MKIIKYISLLAVFSFSYAAAKPFLEFKQAVARYTNYTEHHCFTIISRTTDENVAYKKELRYLFKNYGRFSVNALLSRLRSAHQEMVKQEVNKESESYQRYEQISSALLLVCSLIFFNEVRSQILSALSEIDQSLIYWRYQYAHQISYFFSKSPLKWIIGKKQEQEIIHNILNLEHKQKELCILLGSLTEHVHLFNEVDTTHVDCYTWVEKLVELCACIKTKSRYTDGSRFDIVATQLELKLKRIDEFADDCISSIKMTKKPGHFTRNWIRYAVGAAAVGYIFDFNGKNPEFIIKNLEKIKTGLELAVGGVLIDPLRDLWKVFFDVNSEGSVSNVEKRTETIKAISSGIKAKVHELTAEDIRSLRQYSLELLEQVLIRTNNPKKEEIMDDVRQGKLEKLSKLVNRTSLYYYDEKVDLGTANVLLMFDDVFELLQKYPELIDKNILPLVQEIGFFFGDVGDLITGLSKNHYWTARLSAFAPMATIFIGTHKAYKWATKRNYSPIRIALADVNSLLIESGNELDNHGYGKLLYLIYKLRDKTTQLKDSLVHEFLWDVAKLESKQYSAQTKHDLIENMFHKYPFLGTIVA